MSFNYYEIFAHTVNVTVEGNNTSALNELGKAAYQKDGGVSFGLTCGDKVITQYA